MVQTALVRRVLTFVGQIEIGSEQCLAADVREAKRLGAHLPML